MKFKNQKISSLNNGNNIITNKLPIRYQPKINIGTNSANSIINNLNHILVDNISQEQNKNGVIINEITENNNQAFNSVDYSNGLNFNKVRKTLIHDNTRNLFFC